MGSPSPKQPAKPTGGGLAAFASLLDPNSKPEAGTISRAPVVYEKPGNTEASKGQSKGVSNSCAYRRAVFKWRQSCLVNLRLTQSPSSPVSTNETSPAANASEEEQGSGLSY